MSFHVTGPFSFLPLVESLLSLIVHSESLLSVTVYGELVEP